MNCVCMFVCLLLPLCFVASFLCICSSLPAIVCPVRPFVMLRSCVFVGLSRSGSQISKGEGPSTRRRLPRKSDPRDLSLGPLGDRVFRESSVPGNARVCGSGKGNGDFEFRAPANQQRYIYIYIYICIV